MENKVRKIYTGEKHRDILNSLPCYIASQSSGLLVLLLFIIDHSSSAQGGEDVERLGPDFVILA